MQSVSSSRSVVVPWPIMLSGKVKTYDEAFAVRDACHSAGLVETATVQTVDPVAVAEVREELKIAAPTTVLSPPKKRVRKKKKD